MGEQFYSTAGRFDGAEVIHPGALFNMISHMRLWSPSLANGGARWAKHKIGPGTPSDERDLQMAVYFARYFAKAGFARDAASAARSKKTNYGPDIVRRFPVNTWNQFNADRKGNNHAYRSIPAPKLEDGDPPDYPSFDEIREYSQYS